MDDSRKVGEILLRWEKWIYSDLTVCDNEIVFTFNNLYNSIMV